MNANHFSSYSNSSLKDDLWRTSHLGDCLHEIGKPAPNAKIQYFGGYETTVVSSNS